MALRWSDGKRDFGCLFHQFARVGDLIGKTQVDVFVMPAISDERPLAVTINRYVGGTPVNKKKLGFADVDAALQGHAEIQDAFVAIGCSAESATTWAADVCGFFRSEENRLRTALAAAFG